MKERTADSGQNMDRVRNFKRMTLKRKTSTFQDDRQGTAVH